MTSLPPDLFSSPPRSLSVSSRFFSVSPVLFSPSPKPLYAPVQASFRRRRCAVPRRGQWPVAGCTLRAAARVSRPPLRQSSLLGLRASLSASLPRQVSGRLLCQSFSACRWVDSAAAFPARLLGIFFASPSAVIFLRQPFQVTFPSKSPNRLSGTFSALTGFPA